MTWIGLLLKDAFATKLKSFALGSFEFVMARPKLFSLSLSIFLFHFKRSDIWTWKHVLIRVCCIQPVGELISFTHILTTYIVKKMTIHSYFYIHVLSSSHKYQCTRLCINDWHLDRFKVSWFTINIIRKFITTTKKHTVWICIQYSLYLTCIWRAQKLTLNGWCVLILWM